MKGIFFKENFSLKKKTIGERVLTPSKNLLHNFDITIKTSDHNKSDRK